MYDVSPKNDRKRNDVTLSMTLKMLASWLALTPWRTSLTICIHIYPLLHVSCVTSTHTFYSRIAIATEAFFYAMSEIKHVDSYFHGNALCQ